MNNPGSSDLGVPQGAFALGGSHFVKRRLFVIGGWKMMDIENSSTYKKHVSFATNGGRVDLNIKKMQLNSVEYR